MGFGIPSAIAAAISKPYARSVCITGDGGFLMSAGEILTARRNNLPVIVIVLSDGELNLIKLKQSWKDLKPGGMNLYYGELFGSDIFLGVKVLRADSHESMRKGVNSSLLLKEPVIINAIIDPDDYKWLVVKR
jgi:acetolactate synthase-1/2/3 large subunit